MTQAIDVFSWIGAVGFALISVLTCAAWVRHRTVQRGWLALAIGLLGALSVLGRVQDVTGSHSTLLTHLTIPAFLTSGYALALFRHSIMRTSRLALGALLAALIAVSAGFFAVQLPTGLTPAPTIAQWMLVWGMLLLWSGCVVEPAVRFWLASAGRPVARRARLRALSAGYGSLVALLVTAFGVGILAGPTLLLDQRYQLVASILGAATVPLLYAGCAPPRWLRRLWRDREEAALRRATAELLLAGDTERLADRSLDWALRLVGAERGLLLGPGRQLLASHDVDLATGEELATLDPGTSTRLVRVGSAAGGVALVAPLPLTGEPGMIVVVPGAFTPVFGGDEVTRLGEYAVSVASALERARLLKALGEDRKRPAEAQRVARIGGWEWDVVTDTVSWSEELSRLYGLERHGLAATCEDFLSRVHPHDWQLVAEAVARSYQTHEPFAFEHRIVIPDAGIRWLRGHGEVAVDEAGTVVGMSGTAQDVTQHKLAEERFRGLLESAPDAMLGVHHDGLIAFVNHQAEVLFGYDRSELLGRPIEILVPERAQGVHPRHRDKYFGDPQVRPMGAGLDLAAKRKDGSEFPAEISLSSITTEEGLLVTAAVRDITERLRAERVRTMQFDVTRTLAEAETLAQAAPRILETIGGALEWHAGLLYLTYTDTATLRIAHHWLDASVDSSLFERTDAVRWGSGEGVPGLVWSTGRPLVVADAATDPRVRGRERARQAGLHGAVGFPIVHEGRVVGVISFGCRQPRQADDAVVAVLVDIGSQVGQFIERKRVETALAHTAAQLTRLAATDPLTGLDNRREFERVLALPPRGRFAVLAIDVDDLKYLNDMYGHEAGDEALRAIGRALAGGVRDGDTVARTGGDEFAALLPHADIDEATAVGERLRRSMHGLALGRGQARVSVGCATGEVSDDPLRIWRDADDALFRAKQEGRDRLEASVPGMAATAASRWETLLPSLLTANGMLAVYQPIVELSSGRHVGYEALGRPADGSGDTGVESLFAAADRLRMGRDLDWACRRAALQGAHHLPEGRPVFVNVGADSLLDPVHDVDQMLMLLRWVRRAPEKVVLEITERDAIQDLGRLRDVLAAYRSHGFRFALDDVGEGHSTLEVLAAATPEFVKVAAPLTRRADERGPRSAIEALVTFARASGAHVIAEGLETDEMVGELHRLGVRLGQGFALARPAAVERWSAGAADPSHDRAGVL